MRRITIETLAAGQPRAYADSRTHVRVTWEMYYPKVRADQEEGTGEGQYGWRPNPYVKEEKVRKVLPALDCGFTDFTYPPKDRAATPGDYYATRLEWLREISPGVWEFYTTSAFTD